MISELSLFHCVFSIYLGQALFDILNSHITSRQIRNRLELSIKSRNLTDQEIKSFICKSILYCQKNMNSQGHPEHFLLFISQMLNGRINTWSWEAIVCTLYQHVVKNWFIFVSQTGFLPLKLWKQVSLFLLYWIRHFH